MESAFDLFLWRHADAAEATPGQPDVDRPLTPKGDRQAARMAAWLDQTLPAGTRILASPALRTRQTVAALHRPFETSAALAPTSSVEAALAATGWPDGGGAVLVVGHQPTLGMLAAQVLAGTPQAWSIKKGAVWWLRGKQAGDALKVTLLAVQTPLP